MRKNPIIIAAALMLAVTSASPAWALWGCAAKGNNGTGWATWGGVETKEKAIAGVMRVCQHGGGHCHIVDCSPNVDTTAEADRLWKPAGAHSTLRCPPGKPCVKDHD